jgi:hypothetical protein
VLTEAYPLRLLAFPGLSSLSVFLCALGGDTYSRCHSSKDSTNSKLKILLRHANYDCSLSSHFRAPSVELHDGWVARLNDITDIYEFHNVFTSLTQPEYPLSNEEWDVFSTSLRTVFNRLWQTRTLTVSSILARIESRLDGKSNPESSHILPRIKRLKARCFLVSEGNVADTSAIFTELVQALEEERMVTSLQHGNHVHFLYKRLREAGATIEKLTPRTNLFVEELHRADADTAFPTNVTEDLMNGVSITSTQADTSLSTHLPTIYQPIQFQPLQTQNGTSDFVSSSDMHTRVESDRTQVDAPQGETSNDLEGNPPSTSEASRAMKRKRPTAKDPAKFKHECDVCGERFTRSTTLREHKRTHNDERPFSCSTCPKSFARRKDRVRHEELHAGKKKFICDFSSVEIPGQCGRKFARADGLGAHLRTGRGWKCLQTILSNARYASLAGDNTKEENGFRCRLTQLACHAEFHDFDDLQAHLQDFANRNCATEWLLKFFPCLHHYVRNDLDTESSDSSEADESDSSSSTQRGSQRQQEARDPPPNDSGSAQTTVPEMSLDIREHLNLLPPGIRPMGIDIAQNDTGENVQVTARLRSHDETYSTKKAPSNFDPFAGWALNDAECSATYSTISPMLRIDIVCATGETVPTSRYQIGFGREGEISYRTTWYLRGSSAYRGRIGLLSAGFTLEGATVSIVYNSDHSWKKSFPVGTLRHDPTTLRWKIVPSSPPALPAHSHSVHEILEDEATGVENPPRAITVKDHHTERSTSIDEVATGANVGKHSVTEPTSESISTTGFNSFSGWMIEHSGFEEKQDDTVMIWVYLKPPEGKDPKLPSDFAWLSLTHPESAGNYGSRWYQAECRFVCDLYAVSLKLSKMDWFWKLPVAVHLHCGSDRLKLYVGTRRYVREEQRWQWTQALLGELCKCSVCV